MRFIFKKKIAWFLVLVMVCSMLVGVPVSAEGEVTEFVMSTDAVWQWEEEYQCDVLSMDESSFNQDEKWTENEDRVVVSFGSKKDGQIQYLTWDDIVVEAMNEQGEYVDVTDSIAYCPIDTIMGDLVAYELYLDEVKFGDIAQYRFYQKDNSEELIYMYYEAKRFGYYATDEDDGKGYLNTFYYSEDNTTFYMLPYNKDTDNCVLAPLESAEQATMEISYWDEEAQENIVIGNNEASFANYVSCTNLEGEGFSGYSITVSDEAIENSTSFDFCFRGLEKWILYDEEGNITYEECIREQSIRIESLPDNDFLVVHDESCDISSDMRPVVYDEENRAVGETRYVVDCAIDSHGNRYISKYYTAEEISVYTAEWKWSEENGDYQVRGEKISDVIKDVTDSNGHNSLCFNFEEEGDYYLIPSENEAVERIISVWPAGWMGFYSDDQLESEVWDYSIVGEEGERTFYFAMRDLGEYYFVDDVEFSAYIDDKKVENISSYVDYRDVSAPEDITQKVYAITITGNQDLELVVEADWRDLAYSWSQKRTIFINYVDTGMALGDPVWGEEGLTGEVWDGSYTKTMEGEIYSVRWVYLGTTEDGEYYTSLDVSAFDENAENRVRINDSTDYIVKSQEEWPFASDKDTVIIDENLAANGIYGFYVRDDVTIAYGDDSVTITKQLPSIGFYKGNEATFENYIREEYFMSHSEMFEGMDIYVLPKEGATNYSYTLDTIDKTILVNGEAFAYKHIPDEHPAGYYQSADTFTSPIKVSVANCSGSFLRIKGSVDWGDPEPEYIEQYLGLMYENKDAIILEDNAPHQGFGGCLITESDYNVSQWWQMSGDVYYWVHGETIQDVVDQLSAVAEAGEVTVDGETYPIGMTDYIWLNTSYFKYSEEFANSTQHVVTPSNIKGIIMQAGAEAPYALYDDGDTKGYFQVQEWAKDEDVILLTQTLDGSHYYPVKELSETEAVAQKADYVVSDYNNAWTYEELRDAGYAPVVDEYNDILNAYPVYLPNLYVDATVEVKMIGNFGDRSADKKVQLGFYKGSTNKSIINGKEFSAANIGDEPVVVGDEENQVTVTVTEFKASTECSKAPINGENCEVKLDGENASLRDKIDIYQKGDDDYADAKALAEGKPLKVKLDVKEAKADDAEAKKVAEQMEKDCLADKKKPTKVQYLDIDMKYQVGDRDPKAVTETREEVDITMDVPDSFQQSGKHAKKRQYKVYRYHDGKVDVLDAEFDKDKKEIHFKTDKFSTYALVAEEIVPTGIEVTANPTKLSYVEGELFDTTGMSISLVYSDGTKEKITGYTLSATNALALTDTMVTITYEGFTVQVPITVIEKTVDVEKPEDVLPKVGETVKTTNGSCKVTAIGQGGAVEVTFTPSKSNKKAKKAKIDKKVTINGKEYVVTAIAANAFSGNTKMTSISIPNTVTKIGKNAFKGCTKLKSITIPKNVTEIGSNAFYNCKQISKVTFKGTKVKKIGSAAFRKCSSLKSVTIPKNVTEIGKDAFRDCKKLSKVTFKGTKITKIGKNAFKNIASEPTIKVPKSKKNDYKKLLKKAGYKSKVK